MKTVFTNGCFDILHKGHVELLRKAREYGDQLVVGINSDASVRKNKGPERPIIPEMDRLLLLTELSSVDAVFIFEEETPIELIKKIKPDVLVKGGDWGEEEIVGSEFVKSYGGKVYRIPYIEGCSTTSIIEKIKGF